MCICRLNISTLWQKFPFLSPPPPRRLSSPRSSTLPRSHSTKDSWLLGETRRWLAKGAFGCLVSLAFPLAFGAPSKCEEGGKCDSAGAAFHCWVGRWIVRNVTACVCVCVSAHSYSTVYTMFPVFSLVLDKDVKSEVAMLYPELYKDLLKVVGS